MVELSARFQFYKNAVQKAGHAIGINVIFNDAHIPFLKAIQDRDLGFYPHGTVEEGLRFTTEKPGEKDPNRRQSIALTPYNNKSIKLSTQLTKLYFKSKVPPPTQLAPIKVKWDADKKEFHIDAIDTSKLESREKAWKPRVGPAQKKALAAAAPSPTAPAAAPNGVAPSKPVSESPIERFRTHLRGLNEMAEKLGVQLTLDQGKVRAVLTFD